MTKSKDPQDEGRSGKSEERLGDYRWKLSSFASLDEVFKDFHSQSFSSLGEKQKLERISRSLLLLIEKEKTPCFLLGATLAFLDRVAKENILDGYTFAQFELWLNQFSLLSVEENYLIRAKIAGKFVPREEYQVLFPIGMGKMFPGSHYVTAHSSPDLDTTIASFWGWVDAFAARVGDGIHLWNVPGGPPSSQVEIDFLFYQLLGKSCFDFLAKTRSSLALSGMDLVSQRGVVKKSMEESTLSIDHERNQNAVMLVDEQGYYLGDWRTIDVEGVRQVVMLLNNCLRWFASHLHIQLVSLFARDSLSQKDVSVFCHAIFSAKIQDAEPVRDFTAKQKAHVEAYMTRVLKVSHGLQSTFKEFAEAMQALSIFAFAEFVQLMESLPSSALFDSSGMIVENRPKIFHQMEQVIKGLEKAIQSVRTYVDRLSIASQIKTEVFGYLPHFVSYRAEVEEIRSKMGSYPYLTVTTADKEGNLTALGVIHAVDIHKSILGTVSLRDFCNREETKIPSYLEVISVIDHHKSALTTVSAPNAFICDAQSSNALVAEKAFVINDKYSCGASGASPIQMQIKSWDSSLDAPGAKRIMQRLLQKAIVLQEKKEHFIDAKREFLEYLHCLYAILDDTDLLSKVSYRDVECVASLLNRMKTLTLGEETEIIALDDIARDASFAPKAAKRILQNADMYSLYKKIYYCKEESVEHHMRLCIKGEESSIFADTKEQNGCCRVGQTKLFSKNVAFFETHAEEIRALWYADAKRYYEEHAEVDLHMHMISTIPGAEEVYAGTEGDYKHKDELWIWIPSTEQAVEHVKIFLNAFRSVPQVVSQPMEIEYLGDNAKVLEQIFAESFSEVKQIKTKRKIPVPVAVLKFKAGLINSRKAMISPYLPKLQ